MKLTWQGWVGVVLVILAAVVRFWNLGTVPAALNRDEAALAYNAVLLLETGRDEWGQWWPTSLISFGDYKLPGYGWHLLPFLSVLGQHDWVVRLPAALAGVALVWLSWQLTKTWRWSLTTRAFVTFWVAVSPVSIFFSRMAWEANVALTWFVVALGCLWQGSRPKKRVSPLWDLGAVLAMALAVFTYNTPLLLLPGLILLVVMWRWTAGWRAWGPAVAGLSLVMLVAAAQLSAVASQKSGITIFTDTTVWAQFLEYRQSLDPGVRVLLGNKYSYWLGLAGTHFWQSFKPDFIVTAGGAHPWHQIPGSGHLTWLVYGLGWLGMVASARQAASWVGTLVSKRRWQSVPIPVWLLGLQLWALWPSIITVDAPHTTRSLLFLWGWVLQAGWGLEVLHSWWSARKYSQPGWIWLVSFMVGLSVFFGVEYVWRYFTWYPSQSAQILQAGLPAALEQLPPMGPVAVIDPSGYSYILFAWYGQISPAEFMTTIVKQQPDRIGLRYGQQVGRFHFIAAPSDRSDLETTQIEWKNNTWQVSQY